MAIAQTELKRVFKYNAMTLSDPAPEKTPDQVRLLYAPAYPELTTAVVEGPVTKGGVSTYTFARAAGSKGARSQAERLQAFVEGTHDKGNSPLSGVRPTQLKENATCSMIVHSIVNNRAHSTPLPPPAVAFSLFG